MTKLIRGFSFSKENQHNAGSNEQNVHRHGLDTARRLLPQAETNFIDAQVAK